MARISLATLSIDDSLASKCRIARTVRMNKRREREGHKKVKTMQVVAKYPYTAKRADELSFQKREVLTLVDKRDDKGWWLARSEAGEQGLVPSTYVVPVPVPVAAPAAVAAPAPVAAAAPVVAAAPVAAEEPKEEFGSEWERRAVRAEKALSELLSAVERERLDSDAQVASLTERALRAEQHTRDAEDKALQAAEALQKLQEEQLFSAMMAQAAAAPAAGTHGAGGEEERERTAALEQQVERLLREAEAEREAHQEVAQRAAELFDSYESARAAVEQLQRQLTTAHGELDAARQEGRDIRRKTARMVALVQEQKKEMEQQMAHAAQVTAEEPSLLQSNDSSQGATRRKTRLFCLFLTRLRALTRLVSRPRCWPRSTRLRSCARVSETRGAMLCSVRLTRLRQSCPRCGTRPRSGAPPPLPPLRRLRPLRRPFCRPRRRRRRHHQR